MRAALDLVRRIPDRAPRRIADVYKGRGSMRALLARRFPDAEIEAFDLLRLTDHDPNPGSRCLSTGHKFDLICSNGSLEMVPSLPGLLPMLVGMVAAGGCLAVEFPNDLYEPTRALTRMIAADGPWAKTLLPIAKTRPFNETMEGLYALLSPVCAAVDIWEALISTRCRTSRRSSNGWSRHASRPFWRRWMRPIVASFSTAMPTNCATPTRPCPTVQFCCGRDDSSYWRSRNVDP